MKKILIILISLAFITNVQAQTVKVRSNPVMVDVSQPQVVANAAETNVSLEMLGITTLPKYYALIIGVSNYLNAGPKLPNLDMPAKDAERLYNVLTEKYAFDPNHVTLLKSPTREEIINHLEQMSNEVTDKDNVLIFYAGHGYYDKGKDFGYWLPSDAKPGSTSAWIPNSTIKDYAGAIKSKHTLLITDACFGGSIFKTRSVETMVRRFHELYKDRSRKALTSGNLTEVPDQSVFIKFLIKTLDENTEVFLPSSILFSRIYEPIGDNSLTVPQFGVIQGAGDEGGDFIFIKKDTKKP